MENIYKYSDKNSIEYRVYSIESKQNQKYNSEQNSKIVSSKNKSKKEKYRV
jgi:hypothetical protein